MLKRAFLLIFTMSLVFSCSKNEETKKNATQNPNQAKPSETSKVQNEIEKDNATGEIITVAQLAKDIGSYVGKTIRLKGMVSHVCRRSGKKLFLLGVKEGQNFKVVASGPISTFNLSVEGTEVIVQGKVIQTEPTNKEEGSENCTAKQITGYFLECVEIKNAN